MEILSASVGVTYADGVFVTSFDDIKRIITDYAHRTIAKYSSKKFLMRYHIRDASDLSPDETSYIKNPDWERIIPQMQKIVRESEERFLQEILEMFEKELKESNEDSVSVEWGNSWFRGISWSMNGPKDDPRKDFRGSWLAGITMLAKKVVGGYVVKIELGRGESIPISEKKISKKVTDSVTVDVNFMPADKHHFDLDLGKTIEIIEKAFPNSGLNADRIGQDWSKPDEEGAGVWRMEYVTSQDIFFGLTGVHSTMELDHEACTTNYYPRTYENGILRIPGYFPLEPFWTKPGLSFTIRDRTGLPVVDNTHLLKIADRLVAAFAEEIRK